VRVVYVPGKWQICGRLVCLFIIRYVVSVWFFVQQVIMNEIIRVKPKVQNESCPMH
jgi:hypothetical protein